MAGSSEPDAAHVTNHHSTPVTSSQREEEVTKIRLHNRNGEQTAFIINYLMDLLTTSLS